MTEFPTYSTRFSCIYDEQEPKGRLGRGMHHSILRSVERLDVVRRQIAHQTIGPGYERSFIGSSQNVRFPPETGRSSQKRHPRSACWRSADLLNGRLEGRVLTRGGPFGFGAPVADVLTLGCGSGGL